MTIKTLAAAVALTMLPAMAFATCNFGKHEQASMSCADGSVYDTKSKTCIPTTG